MRKKVRKSLAFLLALALVVSVMSGLGLSVSADDAQNEPVVTETEGEPAEEKPKVEESTPKEGEEEEEADPDAEAVPEEKKDEQKAEGEGSGEKAAENKVAETPKAGENVQTATIGTGDKTVTVKTTAAAGVLPEGAKLVVKKLANQDQAYQDAESTLKDSQVTYIVYTNTKQITTPGGVIMTIAPYALMLVVAGAFAVVFLSRRNRAE